MILMNIAFNGSEEEGKKLLKPVLDLNPAVNLMRMDAYPEVNKLVPAMYGLRSSMKGAACVLPIREEFFTACKDAFESFIDSCDDAAGSVLAWELYDPTKVVELDEGSFANRGYHFNSLIMPLWSKAENDQRCRQFARDASNMFKKEMEEHGHRTSEGVEGGAGVRGKKGAVMLYGNYDVSLPRTLLRCERHSDNEMQQYEEISKDIFGSNYLELQNLKAKYDPHNMFNKLFAITPAKSQL